MNNDFESNDEWLKDEWIGWIDEIGWIIILIHSCDRSWIDYHYRLISNNDSNYRISLLSLSIQFFSLGKNEKITGARLFSFSLMRPKHHVLTEWTEASLRLISLQLVIFKIHKDHVAAALKILSYKFVWRLWRILLQLSTALQFYLFISILLPSLPRPRISWLVLQRFSFTHTTCCACTDPHKRNDSSVFLHQYLNCSLTVSHFWFLFSFSFFINLKQKKTK